MKGVTQTLKNDIKKGGALPLIPMLLGTSGASLLTGRGNKCNCGKGLFRAGQRKRNVQSWSSIKKKLLTPFHPLTNFEIIEYFKDEPRFNGVYSRNNLPKKKNKNRSICNKFRPQ